VGGRSKQERELWSCYPGVVLAGAAKQPFELPTFHDGAQRSCSVLFVKCFKLVYRSKNAVGGKNMKRREEMSLLERLYFLEVIKGVFITSGHLLRNFATFLLRTLGFKKNSRAWATVQYPDEVRSYEERYRGRHRLTLNSDGSIRCTSCFLCATACPAKCIYIEPAEHSNPNIEKFPARYEIDTLLCIYCGYCVEACPVDAIRMDTGIHPEIYPTDPRAFIEDKEILMTRSRILEDQGPKALFDAHMARMKRIEKEPFAPDSF
jgi:NADH-quinone oxidoreductase subunit I